MACQRLDEPHSAPQTGRFAGKRKKNDGSLLSEVCAILLQADISSDHRVARRSLEHMIARLVSLGGGTVTNIISACGREGSDWSADYRLYSMNRTDPQKVFGAVRRNICSRGAGPVVVALDDTRIRKSGRKVAGAGYARDPMAPPFLTNIIWAQRFVQISMAVEGEKGRARMIPVDWAHAPAPAKPPGNAGEEDIAEYRRRAALMNLSRAGADRLALMRRWLDDNDAGERRLWAVVDGGYTNGAFLKNLPPDTAAIGRVRRDAKLYYPPDEQKERGRRRRYGKRAPTPEQLLKDDSAPFEKLAVFFGGGRRTLRAKRIGPVRWRAAGGDKDLQLVALAPTPYKLTKNAKPNYRKPAFLICTDPDAPLKEVVQRYLWRWDIENNLRDEKTIIKIGDAQVRTENSVNNFTGMAVADYAALLAGAMNLGDKNGKPLQLLPRPKWQRKEPNRPTTMALIKTLRSEVWPQLNDFSGFVDEITINNGNAKPQKLKLPLKSAVLYASRCS